MEELKPCPFCGGNPKIRFAGEELKFVCIECITCGSKTRSFPVEENVLTDYAYLRNKLSLEIVNDLIDRVTKLWNRRATDGRPD